MAIATAEAPHVRTLRDLHACSEARDWAKDFHDPQAAWDACERGDWMLWLVGRLSRASDSLERKRLVLAACDCARQVLHMVKPGEDRPRLAIETAERWARGEDGVTIADVQKAADAAHGAAAYARAKMLKLCADIVRKHYPQVPTV